MNEENVPTPDTSKERKKIQKWQDDTIQSCFIIASSERSRLPILITSTPPRSRRGMFQLHSCRFGVRHHSLFHSYLFSEKERNKDVETDGGGSDFTCPVWVRSHQSTVHWHLTCPGRSGWRQGYYVGSLHLAKLTRVLFQTNCQLFYCVGKPCNVYTSLRSFN